MSADVQPFRIITGRRRAPRQPRESSAEAKLHKAEERAHAMASEAFALKARRFAQVCPNSVAFLGKMMDHMMEGEN